MNVIAAFWTWEGWSALVALGTLLLAVATGALAWFTSQVTSASQQEISIERRRMEAAQRPIVLPAGVPDRTQFRPDHIRALVLMNAGPGAALNIECELRWGPPSGLVLRIPKFHMRPGGSDDPLLHVPDNVTWLHVDGTVTCNDLAGDTWVTEFVISAPDVNSEPVVTVQPPTPG